MLTDNRVGGALAIGLLFLPGEVIALTGLFLLSQWPSHTLVTRWHLSQSVLPYDPPVCFDGGFCRIRGERCRKSRDQARQEARNCDQIADSYFRSNRRIVRFWASY